MSDAIRMMDLAPLTRGLEELRRADPEHRAFADRLAASAALRHIEQAHEDVGAAGNSAEVRVDDHSQRDRKKRRQAQQDCPQPQEMHQPEPIPERDEGRLLDIKV